MLKISKLESYPQNYPQKMVILGVNFAPTHPSESAKRLHEIVQRNRETEKTRTRFLHILALGGRRRVNLSIYRLLLITINNNY